MIDIALSTVLGVVARLGGEALVVGGVATWLGKVWANRILEADRARYATEIEKLKSQLTGMNDRARALLDRVIVVRRTQFETEFRLYRLIWRRLDTLRATFHALRPTGDTPPENQTEHEKRDAFFKRRSAFTAALNRFREAVDAHAPFYPKSVAQPLEYLILAAKRENTDVYVDQQVFTGGWFDNGRRRRDEFDRWVPVVEQQIRERLDRLAAQD